MQIKQLLFFIFLMAALAPMGCAGPDHLSENYGKSYDALFQAQVVNPDAPRDPAPVDGMAGYTATQIYNDIYLPGLTSEDDAGE
jgi:hypothetical protein